jgi:hypothetical protein
MMNRVLRNHHYTFNIESIFDLGEPTEVVNPGEPIVSNTTIEITVDVADWDKVSGDIEL